MFLPFPPFKVDRKFWKILNIREDSEKMYSYSYVPVSGKNPPGKKPPVRGQG